MLDWWPATVPRPPSFRSPDLPVPDEREPSMTPLSVVLFRHGPAGERDPARWPDDARRPLTDRGAEKARRAAAGLARLAGPLRTIWSSPLARATATAALLSEAAKGVRVVEVDELRPGGSWRRLIE